MKCLVEKQEVKNEPFIESRGRRSDVDLVDLETQ